MVRTLARASYTFFLAGLVWFALLPGLGQAQNAVGAATSAALLPVPPLTAALIDQSGTLSAAERQLLTQHLRRIEEKHGSQVVILLVASTAPQDITEYAYRVADSWKIGRKAVGDGILIVLAVQDRKMRIEVARALEGALPDVRAHRIIQDQMRPAFKEGRYAAGLSAALDRIDTILAGEGLPAPVAQNPGAQNSADAGLEESALSMLLFAVFFIPIFASVMRSMLGRPLGAMATGAVAGGLAFWSTGTLVLALGLGVLAFFFALFVGVFRGISPPSAGGGFGNSRGRSNGWGGGYIGMGGGGGGYSSGGGGFSSGGGGSFGGGGASGDW